MNMKKNLFFSDEYRYRILDDGTAQILKWKGTDKELAIKKTLDGIPVTSIGEYAFSCCFSLTSVSIPDSVTSIGNNAFFILSDSDLTLTVGRDSYAAQYAEENYIPYI